MKLFDKFIYKPVLGLFHLSIFERIINTIIIISLGAFIGTCNIDLNNVNQSISELSFWYIVPFLVLAYMVFQPIVSLTSDVKEKKFSHYMVDFLLSLIILLIFEFIYKMLVLIFVNYLFK